MPLVPTSTPSPVASATPTAAPSAPPTLTPTPVPTATSTPTTIPTVDTIASLSSNKLVAFSLDAPENAHGPLVVDGIEEGEVLVTVDRRPQNGMLYGLGYDGTNGTVQLYVIASQSGVASPVGETGTFVDAMGIPERVGVDSSTTLEMDFDPVVDRIRVVTSNGQNFRINPNTGAFVDGSSGVSGLNRDPDTSSVINACAYTNNDVDLDADLVTTLYTLSAPADFLYIQTPPSSGNQTNVASLSSAIDSVHGFDIPHGTNVGSSGAPATGFGYAVVKPSGVNAQSLVRIDLSTGTAQSAGSVAGANDEVTGLAISRRPGWPVVALVQDGDKLYRFNSEAPDTGSLVSISGVVAGDSLVGIDFRPATGELVGLGVNGVADSATLYRIDPETGVATVIGAPGQITFVTSEGAGVDLPNPFLESYGVDFNPSVDRLRVVTSSGLNFRANPDSGAAVDGDVGAPGVNPDGAINGATAFVHSASYTNSFVKSGQVTTLYTINASTSTLYIQSPLNQGTQTAGVSIVDNHGTLVFAANLGFDIPPETRVSSSNQPVASGFGFALLNVGGVWKFYSIDLASGNATQIGVNEAVAGVRGLAVGQRDVE